MHGIKTAIHLAITAGAVLFMLVSGPTMNAQTNTEGEKKPPEGTVLSKEAPQLTENSVMDRIQEIRDRIRVAEAEETEETASRLGVTLSHLQERTAKLREIEMALQRLLTTLKRQEALDKEEAFLKEQIQSQRGIGLSESPPYPLSLYDALVDQLKGVQAQKETADLAVKLAERSMEDSRLGLEKAEKNLRGLKEKREGADPSKIPPGLMVDLETAQLDRSLARALVDFQRIHLANLLREKELIVLRIRAAQQNIEWVRSNLHFDESDLAKQVRGIEQRRAELQNRLDGLIHEQSDAEAAWQEAQRGLETARGEGEMAFAKAKLQAREAWRQTYQRVLEQTQEMLQLLGQLEQAWKNRYALIKGGVSPEQLESWHEEADTRIQSTQRLLQLQQSALANLQSKITALEKQVAEPDLDPQLRPLAENRLQAYRRAAEGDLEYLSALLVTQEVNQRLLDEVSSVRERVPIGARVGSMAEKIKKVWNFEIIAIDDRAVTVKKVTFALFILVVGILSIKFGFSQLRRRILPRLQIKATTAAAIEKMLYYFAILILVLFALRMVNIPLTAFAFLGGAIAIGVGFGAQNLINNFISGFIIMAERPIKIGDLVEVDEHFAMVEEIGARCTRIRTGANVHILVPNSSFLEKNIINWTLSDKIVRTKVIVGVVYGSPVQEVKRLLLQSVSEHRSVLKKPEPFVLFNDFGDNALIFEVHFWITMTRLIERFLIESDVRFRVEGLFREAGIVIAFPQRDVHLDTQSPLELRILGDNHSRRRERAEGGS